MITFTNLKTGEVKTAFSFRIDGEKTYITFTEGGKEYGYFSDNVKIHDEDAASLPFKIYSFKKECYRCHRNTNILTYIDILCQHLDCYCCCFDPTGKKFAETSSLSTDFDTDSVYRAIKAFFVQPDKQRDSYFQENNIFIFPCMVNNQMSAALCVVVFEQSLAGLSKIGWRNSIRPILPASRSCV